MAKKNKSVNKSLMSMSHTIAANLLVVAEKLSEEIKNNPEKLKDFTDYETESVKLSTPSPLELINDLVDSAARALQIDN